MFCIVTSQFSPGFRNGKIIGFVAVQYDPFRSRGKDAILMS